MKEVKARKISEVIQSNLSNFINESDKYVEEQAEIVAECIAAHKEQKPIVMVAGPSGSGKKIIARRIHDKLIDFGINAHLITLERYTIPNGEEFDENENPTMIDKALFASDMEKISNAKAIDIPMYNPLTEERSGFEHLDFVKGDVLIVEGLHALNPEITDNCDDYASYVYTSVRTRIINDSGVRLHPSRIRFMRMLVRDGIDKGKPIEEVMRSFKEVQKREARFIMPYKYRANYEIDTFIGYEVSVYKDLLFEKLKEIENDFTDNEEYGDIMKCLKITDSLPLSEISENSVVREFTGRLK